MENDDERIALEKIPMVYVYIPSNGEIVKVMEEQMFLEIDENEGGSFLSKSRLREKIASRRHIPSPSGIGSMSFRLDDILVFHFVDFDWMEEEDGSFMQSFTILEDIFLDESLPRFHRLSKIYLFFREIPVPKKRALSFPVAKEGVMVLDSVDEVDGSMRVTRKNHLQRRKTRKIHVVENI
jgi:hypothetical protein